MSKDRAKRIFIEEQWELCRHRRKNNWWWRSEKEPGCDVQLDMANQEMTNELRVVITRARMRGLNIRVINEPGSEK